MKNKKSNKLNLMLAVALAASTVTTPILADDSGLFINDHEVFTDDGVVEPALGLMIFSSKTLSNPDELKVYFKNPDKIKSVEVLTAEGEVIPTLEEDSKSRDYIAHSIRVTLEENDEVMEFVNGEDINFLYNDTVPFGPFTWEEGREMTIKDHMISNGESMNTISHIDEGAFEIVGGEGIDTNGNIKTLQQIPTFVGGYYGLGSSYSTLGEIHYRDTLSGRLVRVDMPLAFRQNDLSTTLSLNVIDTNMLNQLADVVYDSIVKSFEFEFGAEFLPVESNDNYADFEKQWSNELLPALETYIKDNMSTFESEIEVASEVAAMNGKANKEAKYVSSDVKIVDEDGGLLNTANIIDPADGVVDHYVVSFKTTEDELFYPLKVEVDNAEFAEKGLDKILGEIPNAVKKLAETTRVGEKLDLIEVGIARTSSSEIFKSGLKDIGVKSNVKEEALNEIEDTKIGLFTLKDTKAPTINLKLKQTGLELGEGHVILDVEKGTIDKDPTELIEFDVFDDTDFTNEKGELISRVEKDVQVKEIDSAAGREWEITYTAVDYAGNKSEQTITVREKEKDQTSVKVTIKHILKRDGQEDFVIRESSMTLLSGTEYQVDPIKNDENFTYLSSNTDLTGVIGEEDLDIELYYQDTRKVGKLTYEHIVTDHKGVDHVVASGSRDVKKGDKYEIQPLSNENYVFVDSTAPLSGEFDGDDMYIALNYNMKLKEGTLTVKHQYLDIEGNLLNEEIEEHSLTQGDIYNIDLKEKEGFYHSYSSGQLENEFDGNDKELIIQYKAEHKQGYLIVKHELTTIDGSTIVIREEEMDTFEGQTYEIDLVDNPKYRFVGDDSLLTFEFKEGRHEIVLPYEQVAQMGVATIREIEVDKDGNEIGVLNEEKVELLEGDKFNFKAKEKEGYQIASIKGPVEGIFTGEDFTLTIGYYKIPKRGTLKAKHVVVGKDGSERLLKEETLEMNEGTEYNLEKLDDSKYELTSPESILSGVFDGESKDIVIYYKDVDSGNTEKPTEPEEKPTEPEEKPTEPEEKPEVPEEKPEVPEEKPVVPEEKPVVPEEKPVVPEKENGGSIEGQGIESDEVSTEESKDSNVAENSSNAKGDTVDTADTTLARAPLIISLMAVAMEFIRRALKRKDK